MMRLDLEKNLQRCLRCGSHVTPEFRRGYGDENDRAHRCRNCDCYGRLGEGSAAGQDVDLPDPLEDPTRFNQTLEDLPSKVRSAIEPQSVATDGGEEQ